MFNRSINMEKGCGVGEELDGRIVSYSLNIINRSRTIYFFRNILGMRVICHREYDEDDNLRDDVRSNIRNYLGSDARWSSTIVAYGKESNYIKLELIYVYGKQSYLPGNIFNGMTIRCSRCLKRALTLGWEILPGNILASPGNYLFYILDEPQPIRTDPIIKISLNVRNLKASTMFYNSLVGFRFYEDHYQATNLKVATLGLQPLDTKLELIECGDIETGENIGILGVGVEYNEQIALEEKFINTKHDITVPLIPMDTPGKLPMAILKVQDPDGTDIIFYEYTPYQNVVQYIPEDESRMVKLFENDEIGTKIPDNKSNTWKRIAIDRIIKGNSHETLRSKLKQTTRSLGSMICKRKDSKNNLEEEAGGSSKEVSQPTAKGINKNFGSEKDFSKCLKCRSDVWKDTRDNHNLQPDEPNPPGDKTISRSEQVQRQNESNVHDSVSTQEPVAIEVQASTKSESKHNKGVSNEENKSAQYTRLKIEKTSRGTNSEQRLVDSTTENDSKSSKAVESETNDGNLPPSKDESKRAVQDSIRNLLKKTSSLIQRSRRSAEDMMVDGHLYFNAKFDVIPPSKVKDIVKSEEVVEPPPIKEDEQKL